MAEKLDRKDVEAKLWEAVRDARVGMLGLADGRGGGLQPMTAFVEPPSPRVWFFARRDNDLIRGAPAGARATFNVVDKDRRVWATLTGELSERHDRERIERYWSPVAAAWFPDGKDDPELTLICLDVAEAQVWASEAGPVRFAYEIAKANVTGEQPDLGGTGRASFH